jgi:hypothetical protein
METHGVSAYRAIDLATAAKSPLVASGIPRTVGVGPRRLADAARGHRTIWARVALRRITAALTAAPGVVLGEIHPRSAYAIAKSDESGRAAAIGLLQKTDWVREHGIVLGGLEAARRSDDAFHAFLNAAALLRCVLEGTPLTPARTHPMEGGILGPAAPTWRCAEYVFYRRRVDGLIGPDLTAACLRFGGD